MRLNLGNSEKTETTFGLGESVLAGNMCVSGGLLKQPPYLFQVAGSTEEQYIFRSILPNQIKSIIPSWFINKVGDTHQKNLFDEYGLYSTKYEIAGDFDFFVRIFYARDIRFGYLRRVSVKQRIGGISTSYSGPHK